MLIVFGVAVAGVLVEAFLPRKARYRAQLVLSLGRAGSRPGRGAADRPAIARQLGHSVVAGAVAIDRPTLFLQGTIC